MFKNKSMLEVKGREERIYSFACDPQSPLGEVYDVLQTMLAVVMKQMQEQAHKQEECQKEECCKEQECCEKE